MSEELCGWLIKGDPSRPCVLKPGHKASSHIDAEQRVKYRAGDKKYHQKHVEQNRKNKHAWYLAHAEEQRDTARAWRRDNPEKKRERDRRYRLNRDQVRQKELQREWYLRTTSSKPTFDGFAYILVSRFRPDVVKIGSAMDLKSNLNSARRYLPDAKHLRAYPGGQWLELRYLHRVFAKFVEPSDKKYHEWFAVPLEAVDAAVLILHIILQYPAFLMSKELL